MNMIMKMPNKMKNKKEVKNKCKVNKNDMIFIHFY